MIRALLRIADYFYPSDKRAADAVLRARIIIFLILCSAILISLTLLSGILLGIARGDEILYGISVVLVQLLCLVAIKRSGQFEWIGILYLVFTSLAIVTRSVFVAHTILDTGTQVLPLVLLFGFLISPSFGKRTLMLSVVLALCLFTYLQLYQKPLTLPFGLSADTYYRQMILTTVVRSLLTCFCLYWYVKIKDISNQKLKEEMLWQWKAARVDEISILIKSILQELHDPLILVGTEAEKALSEQKLSPESIGAMDDHLQQMRKYSQGILWIFKAYSNEWVQSTSTQTFREQLDIILTRKFKSTSLKIEYSGFDSTPNLSGPLPTLALLLLALAEILMTHGAGDSNPRLLIHLSIEDNTVIWRLSVSSPKFDQDLSVPLVRALIHEEGELKNDLIDNLVESCAADVREESTEEYRAFVVQGNWLAADAGDVAKDLRT